MLIALLLAFGAAWLSQTFTYIPLSEDFMHAASFNSGFVDCVKSLYEITGIRRSFGMVSNVPLCAAPVVVTNYILLAEHLIATLLIYDVSRRLSRSSTTAYVCALLFGVMPLGYGAITYACGSYVIAPTIFLLLGISIMLRHVENPKWREGVVVAVCSTSFIVCCILAEHLVFATAFAGFLAFTNQSTVQKMPIKAICQPLILAPACTVAIYILLILVTQSGSGLMDAKWEDASMTETFNPTTLLSVWYYQWRNILYLEPLFSLVAIEASLHEIGVVRILVGIMIVATLLGLLHYVGKKSNERLAGEGLKERPSIPWWRSSVPVVLMMMLGASLVHALAGGYSVSSRHNYVPLALVVLLLAAASPYLVNKLSYLARYRFALLAVLSMVAILTNWLVIGINRYELCRYTAICDFFEDNPQTENVRVIYEPPLYYLWPNIAKTTSTPMHHAYAINWSLKARKAKEVVISENASIVILASREEVVLQRKESRDSD